MDFPQFPPDVREKLLERLPLEAVEYMEERVHWVRDEFEGQASAPTGAYVLKELRTLKDAANTFRDRLDGLTRHSQIQLRDSLYFLDLPHDTLQQFQLQYNRLVDALTDAGRRYERVPRRGRPRSHEGEATLAIGVACMLESNGIEIKQSDPFYLYCLGACLQLAGRKMADPRNVARREWDYVEAAALPPERRRKSTPSR